jgi:hypothetical protein
MAAKPSMLVVVTISLAALCSNASVLNVKSTKTNARQVQPCVEALSSGSEDRSEEMIKAFTKQKATQDAADERRDQDIADESESSDNKSLWHDDSSSDEASLIGDNEDDDALSREDSDSEKPDKDDSEHDQKTKEDAAGTDKDKGKVQDAQHADEEDNDKTDEASSDTKSEGDTDKKQGSDDDSKRRKPGQDFHPRSATLRVWKKVKSQAKKVRRWIPGGWLEQNRHMKHQERNVQTSGSSASSKSEHDTAEGRTEKEEHEEQDEVAEEAALKDFGGSMKKKATSHVDDQDVQDSSKDKAPQSGFLMHIPSKPRSIRQDDSSSDVAALNEGPDNDDATMQNSAQDDSDSDSDTAENDDSDNSEREEKEFS